MTAEALYDVLEATGYLANGEPAHGVLLDEEARGRHRTRDFSPDALWCGDSTLTVYFKHEWEIPSDEQVSAWRREIWNQGFTPLLWVISRSRLSSGRHFESQLLTQICPHRSTMTLLV